MRGLVLLYKQKIRKFTGKVLLWLKDVWRTNSEFGTDCTV